MSKHAVSLVLAGLCAIAAASASASEPSTQQAAVARGSEAFYEAPKWMTQAAESASYAKACAHEPRFDDKSLWSHLGGNEAYARQSWPKGRLLVWARPGESGSNAVKNSLDPEDPRNWLEDGKPATSAKFDENTDLLLPAADRQYRVGVYGPVRHVTVEKNACWHALGAYGGNMTVHGNVWIKRGGKIYVAGGTTLTGAGQTFYRNDDLANVRCSQHFIFNKLSGSAVEMLGHITMLDEFTIHQGTVVVGPDSKLQPGRNATPTIRKDGTLALMDGAAWAKWQNDWVQRDIDVAGTVQGGLSDRPLKRSCALLLHFKNYTGAKWSGGAAFPRDQAGPDGRAPSMIVREGGCLRSYSTDPQRARLVVTFSGLAASKYRPPPGSEAERRELQNNPGRAALHKWFDSLPRHIDLWLDKGVQVDGVEFDWLRAGGLMLRDPSARTKWGKVFFGPHCAAAGEALYAPAPAIGRRGEY